MHRGRGGGPIRGRGIPRGSPRGSVRGAPRGRGASRGAIRTPLLNPNHVPFETRPYPPPKEKASFEPKIKGTVHTHQTGKTQIASNAGFHMRLATSVADAYRESVLN